MKKEKFYFNTQTLTYEKVVLSPRMMLLKIVGVISGVFMAALILVSLFYNFYSSPKELALKREFDQMERKYKDLTKSVSTMEKVLINIKERDEGVHRMVFGMNPIDESLWKGGTGGHEQNVNLTKFKNTGTILIEAQEKIERLSHQLVVQSESLDEIEQMAKTQEAMFASMPLITPIRKDFLKRKIHLLSGFGRRLHPIYKVMKMHDGIDFTTEKGTPIQATGDGKVIISKKSPSYGNYVVIQHNGEYESLYAHMDTKLVTVGQKVKRGEQIGTVGNTGHSTAPHLHYEVHYKGQPVNPIDYCIDGLSAAEYQELIQSSNKVNQSLD